MFLRKRTTAKTRSQPKEQCSIVNRASLTKTHGMRDYLSFASKLSRRFDTSSVNHKIEYIFFMTYSDYFVFPTF